MSAQHLRVSTPQGDAGELSHEQSRYLFAYQTANPAAAISLSMPVRKAQYAHGALHPIFQMNLSEGFLLEELQNQLHPCGQAGRGICLRPPRRPLFAGTF